MNREIKFRAWDKSKNKMINSVAILGLWENFVTNFDRDYIYNSQDWNGNEGFSYDYELMQYTGVKDKNGKEIYEGDIIKTNYAIAPFVIVKWSKEFASYELSCNDSLIHVLFSDNIASKDYEVVGNIYETKELLE